MCRRFVVVGTTGVGKSSVAAEVARRLGLRHIELDALHWEPDWQPANLETFRARVAAVTLDGGWIADGNYGKVRDITWGRADTLVWLDYPLLVTLWQLFWRTLRRVTSREVLWGKNRETLTGSLVGRESLLWYAIRTHARRRREYEALVQRPPYDKLHVIRLRSRRAKEAWLRELAPSEGRRES